MTPTGTQLADYLGQVNRPNGSFNHILGAILIIAIWAGVVLYLTGGRKIGAFLRERFAT